MSAPARVKWFGKTAAVIVVGPYLFIYGDRDVGYVLLRRCMRVKIEL